MSYIQPILIKTLIVSTVLRSVPPFHSVPFHYSVQFLRSVPPFLLRNCCTLLALSISPKLMDGF